MKKYIIPRMEVLAVDALLPLMISAIGGDGDEAPGYSGDEFAKGRKNVFNDDDANDGW